MPPAAAAPSAPRFATACHAVDLAGVVPEWVELIPAGEFSGRDGRGPYLLDADAVLQAFAAWGMPLAIDYEHQAFNAADNGQPAPAAGWVDALEVRGGALWGQVAWTERAAAHIGQREYRYLSPVFDHAKDGRVMRLLGAGLTNNPNLYLTALNRAAPGLAANPSPSPGVAMDEIVERLCYMLNLPLTSTPEEIQGHLQRLLDRLGSPETAAMRAALALPEAAGLPELLTAAHARLAADPDPQRYIAIAEHHRVSAERDALVAERDGLLAERHAAQVEQAVGEALAAGKVTPAEEVWARSYCTADLAGFATFVAATPPRVHLGEVATHQRAAAGGGAVPGYTPPAGYRADPDALALHQRALAYQAEHQTDFLTAIKAVQAAAQ